MPLQRISLEERALPFFGPQTTFGGPWRVGELYVLPAFFKLLGDRRWVDSEGFKCGELGHRFSNPAIYPWMQLKLMGRVALPAPSGPVEST